MSDITTAETPTPTPILRRAMRLLPVPLTDREMRERGQAIAAVCREITNHDLHADSVKKELKATETRLSARRSEIAEVLVRGTEMRDVEVLIVADYTANLAREIRTDTGEEIHIRKLERNEWQMPLLQDEAPAAVAEAIAHPGTEAPMDYVDPETGEVTRASVMLEPPAPRVNEWTGEPEGEPVPDPPVTAAEATTRARRERKA